MVTSAPHEQTAHSLIKQYLAEQFVLDGDIVTLTGRYACPLPNAGSAVRVDIIIGILHVEVKSSDKDAPKTHWSKLSDLKIVRSVAE